MICGIEKICKWKDHEDCSLVMICSYARVPTVLGEQLKRAYVRKKKPADEMVEDDVIGAPVPKSKLIVAWRRCKDRMRDDLLDENQLKVVQGYVGRGLDGLNEAERQQIIRIAKEVG